MSIPRQQPLPPKEMEELDRFYREGGLRQMASPHVHYDDGKCPHPDCDHTMEWFDFQPELYGDPETIYKPLVLSWWQGTGFVGRCPQCQQWVHFTTLKMIAVGDEEAAGIPKLPDNWHTVAQFA